MLYMLPAPTSAYKASNPLYVNCIQPYHLLMQVRLLLMSLTFHKVVITSRSFLEAVTGGVSLHFLSSSPFSEIGPGEDQLYRIVMMNC